MLHGSASALRAPGGVGHPANAPVERHVIATVAAPDTPLAPGDSAGWMTRREFMKKIGAMDIVQDEIQNHRLGLRVLHKEFRDALFRYDATLTAFDKEIEVSQSLRIEAAKLGIQLHIAAIRLLTRIQSRMAACSFGETNGDYQDYIDGRAARRARAAETKGVGGRE